MILLVTLASLASLIIYAYLNSPIFAQGIGLVFGGIFLIGTSYSLWGAVDRLINSLADIAILRQLRNAGRDFTGLSFLQALVSHRTVGGRLGFVSMVHKRKLLIITPETYLVVRTVALTLETSMNTSQSRASIAATRDIAQPVPYTSEHAGLPNPDEVSGLLRKLTKDRRGLFGSQTELTDALYSLLADIETDANMTAILTDPIMSTTKSAA
jgi:hypothetical protein